MKAIAWTLLLVAGTLSAQTNNTSPAPPSPPDPKIVIEPLVVDATKPLLPMTPPPPPPAPCAIPLQKVPILQDHDYKLRVVPAPLVDPKMIVKPAVPACAEKAAPAIQPAKPKN